MKDSLVLRQTVLYVFDESSGGGFMRPGNVINLLPCRFFIHSNSFGRSLTRSDVQGQVESERAPSPAS